MNNSLLHSRLYRWYDANHRILPWRETEDGYRIWLSEVILQQTRVQQGLDYYLRFVARWPRVEDLAAAAEEDVLREWQGLGYYSRARNLHKAAQMIVARGWAPFPTRFEDIRQLPGVGDYTAGAIASFAYDQPYPAMDGNVYRVLARLLDIDEAFDTTGGKKLFRQKMDELFDRDHPRLYNSAIMEFGALYCTPVLGDNCALCPLQGQCMGYSHGTAALLPVRKPRPKIRERWLNYRIFIAEEDGAIWTLLHQRTEKDIWYHLYEFPCKEGAKETKGEGLELTHILSHQKLHARFRVCKVNQLPEIADCIRIRFEEIDDYPLSRLTLKALEKLGLKTSF